MLHLWRQVEPCPTCPLDEALPANDVTCVDLLMMWVMGGGSTSQLLIYNQAIDGRLAANQRDMDDFVGYHTGVD